MKIQELFLLGMARHIPELIPMPEGLVLNVGAGNKQIAGATPLDFPDWDADIDPIPYKDKQVDGIYAFHFLEHCVDPIYVLKEFQRVLKPGGIVNIVVPYYNSQMQAQDLDHKARFCETTWKTLFANPYYDKQKIEWKFEVNVNIIIGVVERNLCLMTQLIKK